jgi:hypothetical protein
VAYEAPDAARPQSADVDAGGLGAAEAGADGKALSSALSKGSRVNQLTPAEVTALCREADQWEEERLAGQEFHKALCQWNAYGAATRATGEPGMREACALSYEACLSALPAAPTDQLCEMPLQSCTITVAELEGCVNDTLAFSAKRSLHSPNVPR